MMTTSIGLLACRTNGEEPSLTYPNETLSCHTVLSYRSEVYCDAGVARNLYARVPLLSISRI